MSQFLKSSGHMAEIALALFIGLLFGLPCMRGLPQYTLTVQVLLIGVYIVLKRPEVALLGILCATSSILFEDALPLVRIGIGSLHISDILLLAMLCLILIRGIVEPEFKLVRTPLDVPIFCFFGIALFSTFAAILNGSVSRVLAFRETRVLSYFLSFFIVTNMVRTKKQLKLLIYGIILLGVVVSSAMIVQYLMGASVQLFPGRIENYSSGNAHFTDVTRILPPGQSLVFLNFVILLTLLLVDKFHTQSIVWFLLTSLLGIGVILTFNRNFWGGISIAVALLFVLLRDSKLKRLIPWFIIIAMLLAGAIFLVVQTGSKLNSNSPMMAVISRFSTLFSRDTLNEESLRNRYLENGYAISKVIQYPIVGMGLGAMYRPWNPNLDYGAINGDHDLRDYIHNGHLGMVVKTGLLGYASFLWFSALFVWRGLKFWKKIQDVQDQAVFLAIFLAYMGIFVAAIVNPVFQQWFWTPVFGIIMGINELFLRFAENSKHELAAL